MSKRLLINNYSNNNNWNNKNFNSKNNGKTLLKPLLTKGKAEQMCHRKLRQAKRLKTNLYTTVLVKNTLKYVQSCGKDTIPTETFHNEEYQPFNKKPCKDISSDDIDKILDELSFSLQMSERKFNWKDSKFTRQDAFEVHDDETVVSEIEIFEYEDEEKGFHSNNIGMKLDSIWDLSICC